MTNLYVTVNSDNKGHNAFLVQAEELPFIASESQSHVIYSVDKGIFPLKELDDILGYFYSYTHNKSSVSHLPGFELLKTAQ